MLRSLVVLPLVLPLLIACSKDPSVPTAPASKAAAVADAPSAPTNLRIEALTDTSAKVAWDAAEGATDYDLNYKTLSGRWTNWPVKGAQKAYTTIYGLSPDTEYRWAVRAENSDGASKWVRAGKNFTTWTSEQVKAWRFEFRFLFDNDLTENIPVDYIGQIYKAAQKWESVIVNIGTAEHFKMPDSNFRVRVEDDWLLRVRNPATYLGSADMEIVVSLDELSNPEAWAGTYQYSTDGGIVYIPIVIIKLTNQVIREIEAGRLDKRTFHEIFVHELGHALGFKGLVLKEDSNAINSKSGCIYVGPKGVIGFSDMNSQNYKNIPMTDNCSHWDALNYSWQSVWDTMFPWPASIPNDKLISRASLGVFEGPWFCS